MILESVNLCTIHEHHFTHLIMRLIHSSKNLETADWMWLSEGVNDCIDKPRFPSYTITYQLNAPQSTVHRLNRINSFCALSNKPSVYWLITWVSGIVLACKKSAPNIFPANPDKLGKWPLKQLYNAVLWLNGKNRSEANLKSFLSHKSLKVALISDSETLSHTQVHWHGDIV